MAASAAPASPSDIVRLNVGGTVFWTTRSTLLKGEERTFFHGLLDGVLPPVLDSNGCYFLDRDGDLFRPILQYLRTGEWTGGPRALDEARFYGVTPTIFESLTDQHLVEYYRTTCREKEQAVWAPFTPQLDRIIEEGGQQVRRQLKSLVEQRKKPPKAIEMGFVWVPSASLSAPLRLVYQTLTNTGHLTGWKQPGLSETGRPASLEKSTETFQHVLSEFYQRQTICANLGLHSALCAEPEAISALQSYIARHYKLTVSIVPLLWGIADVRGAPTPRWQMSTWPPGNTSVGQEHRQAGLPLLFSLQWQVPAHLELHGDP